MNEELKIIIKAVSTDAKKNLEGVKKELAKIEGEGQKAKKSLGETMKVVAKGAAAAVATITALTAAMVSLGKAAVEAQKGISKLNNAFESNGSTVKQAGATYKELFGFLGDSDKAVEAAQSLALITQNKDELKEYETILKGVYASMGDKLPVEGLAEAINATIQIGQVDGVMADAIEWMGISLDGFNAALKEASTIEEREVLVRNTLNGLYSNSAALYDRNNQATIQYNKSQAELNLKLAEATRYTAPLMTSLNNLSSTLLTFFGPALQTIATYLTAFIQLIAEAIQWVGSFFGMFGGKTETAAADFKGYYKAMDRYTSSLRNSFGATNNVLEDTSKQISEIKKQTMGFDELNIVSNPSTSGASGGGGGGGGMSLGDIPAAPNPADFGIGGDLGFEDMKKDIEEAKDKLKGLLLVVGLIGAGVGAWKLGKFVADIIDTHKIMKGLKDVDLDANWNFLNQEQQEAVKHSGKLKAQFKQIAAYALIIGGAIATAAGASDAWANGVDWGNMALMIGGVAAAVTGLALAFGPLAAVIGAAIGGVVMIVSALKDIGTNGPTVENVILLIAGALTLIIPIIWAFNTALIANPIGAVIAACAALVIGIGALVVAFANEEPAIKSVEDAQLALNEAKEAAKEAEDNYIAAVDNAEAALKKLQEAEEKSGLSGEELYKQVQEGTLDYANMNDAQKEVYKAYLDNEKKQKDLTETTKEFNDAKKKETIASFENQAALAKESGNYDDYKKSVVDAFKKGELSADEARDLIEKAMGGMSKSARETFSRDLPGSIKDGLNPTKYESSAKKLGKFFGNIFIGIANAVIDILNAIIWPFKAAFVAIAGLFGVKVNGGYKFETIPRIPYLAKGGILTEETVFVGGEGGKKEAVLPLEQNTEWMDVLAERINGSSSAPSKLVLAVDGKELGWASINGINGITRQTGTLPLELSLV